VTPAFGARLVAATTARGPLCAGIDPHPALLDNWGYDRDPAGLERFALRATEVLAPRVAVVKPQSALFEAHGAAGMGVLQRVIEHARAAGALVLLDVKRGDIGSTMAGYAAAYLDAGGALAVDAITVSPYLGFGSLWPVVDTARKSGAGVFVLSRTSNPESAAVQLARLDDGRTVAQSIVDEVAECNVGAVPCGDVGVVVGATTTPGDVDLTALHGPILAPGFGAQGAGVDDLRRVFGANTQRLLPVAARSILAHGPDEQKLAAAVHRAAAAVAPLVGTGL